MVKPNYKKIEKNIKQKEKEGKELWEEIKGGMRLFEDWEDDNQLIDGGVLHNEKDRTDTK